MPSLLHAGSGATGVSWMVHGNKMVLSPWLVRISDEHK